MGWVSGIVVYLLIWWVILFTVLPWGVNRDGEDAHDTGTPASAPKNPKIKEKFLATTVISAVIWVVIYMLIAAEIISFRDVAAQMSLG